MFIPSHASRWFGNAGFLLVTWGLLAVTGVFGAGPNSSTKRLPVPDAAARDKALATVRDLFKSDIDKAKTAEDQLVLAEKFMKTAGETKDDRVSRFVLWQLAVETATKAGDLRTAFAAVDEMAKGFEIDELSIKSKTFVGLVPKIAVKNSREAVPLGMDLVDRAVAADRFEIAKTVTEPLARLAQRLGDPATTKEVTAQRTDAERLEKAFANVPAALKTLTTDPTDATANLTVGKYQLDKGDWNAALSYLALSEDAQYNGLAAKELARPKDVNERIAIADEWWKLGEAEKGPLKDRLQMHAVEIYTAALPDATGLTKKKIEAHLADVAKTAKGPGKAGGARDQRAMTNTIGMKLNLIPAGDMVMGSPETELVRRDGETQHLVKITKPYYMGVYPVTRGEFAQFVAAEKYKTEAEKDGSGAFGSDASGVGSTRAEYNWRNPGMNGNTQTDEHPVVSVSWNDAVAFCEWLSKKESKKYRLPTEAEWEYACRAGSKTAFNFGDWLNGTQANCRGEYPYGSSVKGPYLKMTTKVGSYKPNAIGLFDMHGNVWQWCEDWYDSTYYTNSPGADPTGPTTGSYRIARGGAWNAIPAECRSANRHPLSPRLRGYEIGFRVVCEH